MGINGSQLGDGNVDGRLDTFDVAWRVYVSWKNQAVTDIQDGILIRSFGTQPEGRKEEKGEGEEEVKKHDTRWWRSEITCCRCKEDWGGRERKRGRRKQRVTRKIRDWLRAVTNENRCAILEGEED